MKNFIETYYPDFKKTCQYCAITSFTLGTLLFIIFLISEKNTILFFGLYFTLFAIAFNALLFLINTFCAIFSDKNRKKYLVNSGILLINIPIAILYFYIVLKILDL